MLLPILGFVTFVYILAGIVVHIREIEEVKDRADAVGLPRWYEFTKEVLLWGPDRILRRRGR